MIVSKVRNPRFVTIRRGGTLADSDRHLLYGLTMSNASRGRCGRSVGLWSQCRTQCVSGGWGRVWGAGGPRPRRRSDGGLGPACSSSTARGRVVAELGPSGGWGPVDLLEVAESSSVKLIRLGSRTVWARVGEAAGNPEDRAGQLHDRVVQ